MKTAVRLVVTGLGLVAALSGCATVSGGDSAASAAAESGYFLSLKQKGQLIGKGRIQDARGTWYDVWIAPGYVEPARRANASLGRSGRDFAEYVGSRKYRDLAHGSRKAFRWAYADCLYDFTVKGVPRAWRRYWSGADRRLQQRVFGWWLAHPWAFMEGTVDTAVRVPLGLGGTLLGTGWGGAVVPGYYALNSAVAGTWHLAVDTVLLPAAASGWNTVVSPPLALVGQTPAPSRADGFWLRQLTAESLAAEARARQPLGAEDLAALAAWGRALLTATQPHESRREALREQIRAEREALQQKAEQAEALITSDEEAAVRTLVADPSHEETLAQLRRGGFDAERSARVQRQLAEYIREQTELTPEEVSRILFLLTRYVPLAVPTRHPLPGKTDPLQHSLETIKALD